jgi:hypothetical protein
MEVLSALPFLQSRGLALCIENDNRLRESSIRPGITVRIPNGRRPEKLKILMPIDNGENPSPKEQSQPNV